MKDKNDLGSEARDDYVRRKIAVGIKAADEGRIVSHEEVKKRFLSGTVSSILCR
jgi:predicted transcriptional regulator